jgi:hypothetical protein
MTISIDFDDTWSKDPQAWATVASVLMGRGHKVVMCTNRLPQQAGGMDDAIKRLGVENVHFAGHQLKRNYMESKNIHVDVWIDDNPSMIEQYHIF